jgi:NAD(P)-dependent dehydrogenase (short-subunit alcohol dehydrogenase family)
MVDISGAVVVVTGGTRGLGKAIVDELLARGAAKVYATSRSAKDSTDPRIVVPQLEVTDDSSVDALAALASDATIVINNAALLSSHGILDDFDAIRADFEANVLGVIRVSRAFSPVLARNGGGALLNMLSVASWLHGGGYSASKAAAWAVTNSLRLELHQQGTTVTGVHVGYIDTDMVKHVTEPKNDPAHVARMALDGLESGAAEVLVDEITRETKLKLADSPLVMYPQLTD